MGEAVDRLVALSKVKGYVRHQAGKLVRVKPYENSRHFLVTNDAEGRQLYEPRVTTSPPKGMRSRQLGEHQPLHERVGQGLHIGHVEQPESDTAPLPGRAMRSALAKHNAPPKPSGELVRQRGREILDRMRRGEGAPEISQARRKKSQGGRWQPGTKVPLRSVTVEYHDSTGRPHTIDFDSSATGDTLTRDARQWLRDSMPEATFRGVRGEPDINRSERAMPKTDEEWKAYWEEGRTKRLEQTLTQHPYVAEALDAWQRSADRSRERLLDYLYGRGDAFRKSSGKESGALDPAFALIEDFDAARYLLKKMQGDKAQIPGGPDVFDKEVGDTFKRVKRVTGGK